MHGWLRTRGSPRARAPSWPVPGRRGRGQPAVPVALRRGRPALAADLWDLDDLAAAYREFLCGAQQLTSRLEEDLAPEQGFAVRTLLVHEWRKFLFRDPGLPDEVLPADWPGRRAAVSFDSMAASLLPLARTFVDDCLSPDSQTRS